MFFGRILNAGEIEKLKEERDAADRRYNEALTSVDNAVPTLPEFPHPPLAYDEVRLPELNQRWQTAGEPPAGYGAALEAVAVGAAVAAASGGASRPKPAAPWSGRRRSTRSWWTTSTGTWPCSGRRARRSRRRSAS